MRPPIREIFEG